MSFILDALRKSEHARQHLGGATLAELPLGRRHRSQPWWVIALAALLLINLLVLTVVLMRKSPEATPQPQANSTQAPTHVAAQAALSPPGAPVTAPQPAQRSEPPPLAVEAAPPPNVQYETIPRSEAPLDVAPVEGPTLVKPTNKSVEYSSPSANGLPDLHVDMHVYAKEPKDRFVFINMHKYSEGQALPEGPRVTEITGDGVVLSYQGKEIRLPRN